MTTDERISKDLAVAGRLARERPVAVEATLRKVGALRAAAGPSSAPSLVLLTLARVYAARIARAWAGAVAAALTIALLVYVAIPREDIGGFGRDLWGELFYGSQIPFVVLVAAIALMTHLVAARSAMRRFELVTTDVDPVACARRLVDRADGWALAGPIGGASCVVLFFGFMWITIGGRNFASLIQPYEDPNAARVVAASLVLTALSISAAFVGTFVVARSRRGTPARFIATGLTLGILTVIAGMRFDVGPLWVTLIANDVPSMALRAALAVPGTIAVFLVIAGIALRQRQREQAELGS